MDFPTILLYSNIFYDAWNTFGIRKIFGGRRLSQFGIEEKHNLTLFIVTLLGFKYIHTYIHTYIGLVIQNIKSV